MATAPAKVVDAARVRRPVTGSCLGFDLAAEAEALRRSPLWRHRGHDARTLVKLADLRLVLIALRAGARLHEHSTCRRVSLQVLTGRVQLHLAAQTVEVRAGAVAVLDELVRHDLVADEDSVVLLTLSGGAEAPRASCADDLASLKAEHQRFARLLALAEEEVAGDGRAPDLELLREVFAYMTSYPDRFHHPREDLLFARLAARAPATCADVEDLRRLHRLVAERGARLLADLTAAVERTPAPRSVVEPAVQEYVALFREHMEVEERLFPLAWAHLRREDCDRVRAVVVTEDDPIFGALDASRCPR